MSAYLKNTAGIVLLLCATQLINAQAGFAKYELSAGLSAFVYQGDLTPSRFGSYKTIRPGINLSGTKLMNDFLSYRLNLAFGGLRGDDAKYSTPAYRQQRNFYFRTPVAEISAQAVWNLAGKNYSPTGLSAYVFGGAGLSFLKVRRDWSRFNAEYFSSESTTLAGLAADTTHAVPGVMPVLPVGAGLRYGISQRMAITFEISYRLTFTDYLDGFSKAANPARNDHYYTHTIGLIYRMGVNKWGLIKCPKPKY